MAEMEVDSDPGNFLESDDDDDDNHDNDDVDIDEEDVKEQTPTKPQKQKKTNKNSPKTKSKKSFEPRGDDLKGKTDTLRIWPIPTEVNEAHFYHFLQTECQIKPQNLLLVESKHIGNSAKMRHEMNRVGYIQLQSPDQASATVSKGHGKELMGSKLRFNWTKPMPRDMQHSALAGKTEWLYLSNVPSTFSEEDLNKWISDQCDNKVSPKTTRLIQHSIEGKRNGAFRGYASVQFNSVETTKKVYSKIFWKKAEKLPIFAKYKTNIVIDRKKELRGKTNRCLLVNIPWNTTGEDLKTAAAGFGEIANVSVWKDKRGYPRCIAAIVFKRSESATKCYDGLHGQVISGKTLTTAFSPLPAKKAKRKGKKAILKNKKVKKVVTNKSKKKGKLENNKKAKIRQRINKSGKDGEGKRKGGVKREGVTGRGRSKTTEHRSGGTRGRSSSRGRSGGRGRGRGQGRGRGRGGSRGRGGGRSTFK